MGIVDILLFPFMLIWNVVSFPFYLAWSIVSFRIGLAWNIVHASIGTIMSVYLLATNPFGAFSPPSNYPMMDYYTSSDSSQFELPNTSTTYQTSERDTSERDKYEAAAISALSQ